MLPEHAIIYVRISDARNGETTGVDDQAARCRKKAAELGWQVGRVIVENDTSAFKRRKIKLPDGRVGMRVVRPGWRAMLDDLYSGRADGMIGLDLDRAARDPRDLEDLIDVVESRSPRIPVESVTGSLRLANDADVTMARVMVAVANKSSRDTARRVAARREQKASEGRFGGGRRPFGYEPDGVTVRAEEAAEVARWADWLLAGDSMNSLLADLRQREVPTVTGAPWSSRTIRDILLRPRNAGIAVYRGQEIGAAAWPAILSEDVWRAVVALLGNSARRSSPGNSPKWLGSLIYRCGVCGDGQTVYVGGGRSSHNKLPTYVCRSHGHLRRVAVPVDELVAGVIIARLSRPDAAELFAAAQTPGKDTVALAREAHALRARIDEAADLWESGALPAAALKARTTRLRERLAVVEGELSRSSGDPLAGLAGAADVAERWSQLSLGQQRGIVRTLITVTLLPSKPGRQPGGGYFNPETVRIEWNR
jgi:DNA invertase Pin-like site-specific DNA recombinase